MDNNKLTVPDWVVEEGKRRMLAQIVERIAWCQYVLSRADEPSLKVGDVLRIPLR